MTLDKQLIELIPKKQIAYRWYRSNGTVFHNVSLEHDSENIVSFSCDEDDKEAAKAGLFAVLISEKAKRSEAAKKAAETRRQRTKARVYEVARALVAGRINPAVRCHICRKIVTDDESRLRGIGSDCWQDVLRAIERLKGGAE